MFDLKLTLFIPKVISKLVRTPCCYALLMMINIAMQLELNSYFIEFYFNLTNFMRNCVRENLIAL
jgi:hypothetical protein